MVAAAPRTAAGTWNERLLASLPHPSGLMAPVQERGRAGLGSMSVPGRAEESWRFTSLDGLTALDPAHLRLGSTPSRPFPAPPQGAFRLVLDGRQDPLAEVPLPKGLSRIELPELHQRLGQTLEANGCRQHWPVLLNKAAASQVVALRVRGPVAPVLELVSDAGEQGVLLPLRILLVLEEEASLSLLQVHRSAGANLTSVVVEACLGAGARLHHGLLGFGHPAASLMANIAVCQDRGSDLTLASALAGWGLVRCEPRVQQLHGSARTVLRGLQLVRGREVADTHSLVAFRGPEGSLDQLHKAVADGAGRSVFNGAVQVPREAQRTDAAQLSRSLLLSERARVDTKPELEIVADDVRCAHGATVSRLQEDQLFYLQSRGISAAAAAALLLRAYCEEILCDLPHATHWQPLNTLLGDPSDR